jgi:valyl-tRNA synthetase
VPKEAITQEILKAYEPQEIEERWAKSWFDEKLFRAENSGNGSPFSIALPPPNITGSIHIGHMLEHTQIHMLVRWHRMRGHRAPDPRVRNGSRSLLSPFAALRNASR